MALGAGRPDYVNVLQVEIIERLSSRSTPLLNGVHATAILSVCPSAYLFITIVSYVRTELSMGWVNPRVGLGWIGLGRDFLIFGGLGCVVHGSETAETHKLKIFICAEFIEATDVVDSDAREFAVLSQVARRVLCIPASSAQSERVGNTITDTRSRLSEGKVESIELIRWGLRADIV